MEVAAALTSMGAYDSVETPVSADMDAAKSTLIAAGFTNTKRYEISLGQCPHFLTQEVVNDTDAAFLWKRGGECLLAFRGSNCLEDGFQVSPANIFKYGYTINHDYLSREFEPLLDEMSLDDFQDCSSLDVTGHSMGGGMASIFAVLNNAGELKLNQHTVRGLYAFAPVKVFHGAVPTNMKSSDGCFEGGVYCGYDNQGVDAACAGLGADYMQPKTNYVKLGAQVGTTSCTSVDAQALLAEPVSPALFPVHAPHNSVNWLGCSDAQIPCSDEQLC
jgi:hypothetical protein